MQDVLVLDSATQLDARARGQVVACGSHGGLYPAWLAARAGVRAAVFNDAGIGRHSAGVSGVLWLSGVGIPACAVDHRSARIGDAADTLACGRVTTVNEAAAALGCLPGHSCREALGRLLEAEPDAPGETPEIGQTRLAIANSGHRAVWALDSLSLARDDDRRAILVTGSHGALLGARPDGLPAQDVFAAFFNDAGGGKDGAGFSRLASLDGRGIVAGTVSCQSARIGDGRSSYDTGVLSRVNEAARRLDLKEGLTMREAVARLVGLG